MTAIGELLQGRYRIERLLGQGGMGGVYEATHTALEERVAVKELILPSDLDEEMRALSIQQFRIEAQILMRLQHDGLPRVLDFFELNRSWFLIMEFVEGRTLEARFAEGRVEEPEALEWLRQILIVLDYLHTRNPPVIFRDLKPANIMLTPDQRIVLVDFGIAKVLDPTNGRGTGLMARGIGTPGYSAPELYRQAASDARTDLYALGATFYALLAEMKPPSAVDRASGKVNLEPLQKLRPDLSNRLCTVIEWMLELGQNRRPQSVDVVQRALFMEAPGAAPTLQPSVDPSRTEAFTPDAVEGAATPPILPSGQPAPDDVRTEVYHPPVELPPRAPAAWSTPHRVTNLKAGEAPPWSHLPTSALDEPEAPAPARRPRRGGGFMALLLIVPLLLLLYLGYDFLWGPRGRFTLQASQTPVAATPARLKVTSRPPGARVLLNGRPVGTTPALVEQLEEGQIAVVQIVAAGRLPALRTLTLKGGDNALDVALEPSPNQVAFKVTPVGSEIRVNGRYEATSLPGVTRVPLKPGSYQVHVTHPGYKPRQGTIKVVKGKPLTVSFNLTPEPQAVRPPPPPPRPPVRSWPPGTTAMPPPPPAAGRSGLAVTSDTPSAQVLVDGRAVGRVPLTLTNLPAGRHIVVVFDEEGRQARAVVEVPSDRVLVVNLPLGRNTPPNVDSLPPPAPPPPPPPPAQPTFRTLGSADDGGVDIVPQSVSLFVRSGGTSPGALQIRSTGATRFSLAGYPTDAGPRIHWSTASGGLSPGQTVSIDLQVDAGVPPGTYRGNGSVVTNMGSRSFPVVITVR